MDDEARFSDYSDDEHAAEVFGLAANMQGTDAAARRERKRRRIERQRHD